MRTAFLALLGLLALPPLPVRGDDRLRVNVETDIGGDADDQASFVRFLLYANEWDVEGIIADRPAATFAGTPCGTTSGSPRRTATSSPSPT